MKPTWKNIFNTKHKWHGMIDTAADCAYNAGYPYMVWNDWIYKLVEEKDERDLICLVPRKTEWKETDIQ